jgi:hypothetical protein
MLRYQNQITKYYPSTSKKVLVDKACCKC